MSNTTKISFNIDNNLLKEAMKVTRQGDTKNQTYMLSMAISDGVNLRKEVEKQERLFELVSLKTLFFMRKLAGSRGEEVVTQIDAEFKNSIDDLKRIILEEGMDYAEKLTY